MGYFHQKNFQDLRELADGLRALGQPIDLQALVEAMDDQDTNDE